MPEVNASMEYLFRHWLKVELIVLWILAITIEYPPTVPNPEHNTNPDNNNT
jgi:hypothetical protein